MVVYATNKILYYHVTSYFWMINFFIQIYFKTTNLNDFTFLIIYPHFVFINSKGIEKALSSTYSRNLTVLPRCGNNLISAFRPLLQISRWPLWADLNQQQRPQFWCLRFMQSVAFGSEHSCKAGCRDCSENTWTHVWTKNLQALAKDTVQETPKLIRSGTSMWG